MDANQKGKITELKVLLKATELGIEVSIPYGDKSRYDQIWDINGHLYKIQIKTSHYKDDTCMAIKFNCYTSSNRKRIVYTKEQVDYFCTWWDDKVYLVPIDVCSIEKTLWFELPKQYNNCSLAADYEIEKIIKQL